MGYTLPFTGSDIQKALDTQINTPWHDSADNAYTTASRQALSAGTEYDFENNGIAFESTNFPAHITKLRDKTTNKCFFQEVQDHPVYVARLQLTFDPTIASAGIATFRAYIDDAIPKLIQTISIPYKSVEARMEALFAFYIGSDTGYDMKTDGLKFTYEVEGVGDVFDRGILVYQT